jgi:hydrogenase/urease accessory protein HupE
MNQKVLGLLVLLGLVVGGAAHAHPGSHADVGFATGLAHLFTEPDHLLAMVAAGIAAVALLRARSGILRLGGVAILLAGTLFVLLV